MRTVGQILKEEREAKFYTVEEIEKATKIRKEFLTFLEEGDYQKLPPATFIQGFIKNYAKFLKVDPEKLLAIFRREYGLKETEVMEAFSNPNKTSKFKLTPARVIGSVFGLVILIFFIYLWFQYRQFIGAPQLEVLLPQDQQIEEVAEVLVEGKTDPESKVTINDQEVGLTDKGEFKQEVQLTGPVNKIIITSASKFGQKTQVERTVYLKRE